MSYFCHACNGGNFGPVFSKYAKKNFMYLEADWPYTSGTTRKAGECDTVGRPGPSNFKTAANNSVKANSVVAMKTALTKQPVSVAI